MRSGGAATRCVTARAAVLLALSVAATWSAVALAAPVEPTAAPTVAPTWAPATAAEALDFTPDPEAYNVQLLPAPGVPLQVRQAMDEVKTILESLITGDIPDIPAWNDKSAAVGCATAQPVEAGTLTPEVCEAVFNDAGGWFPPGLVPYSGTSKTVFAGAIDDIAIQYGMDETLTVSEDGYSTLAYAAAIFRRPLALDPFQRPYTAIVAVNPKAWEALDRLDALVDTLLHEIIHALGFGTNWPTPAGCGNLQTCKTFVTGLMDGTIDLNGDTNEELAAALQPAEYFGEGAKGPCYADAMYTKLCTETEGCEPEFPLLMEFAIPDDPNFGSNCGHFSEIQTAGEILSSTANNPDYANGKLRGHITEVSVAALQDLGYEVNYKSEYIEPFASIYTRRLRKNRNWL